MMTKSHILHQLKRVSDYPIPDDWGNVVIKWVKTDHNGWFSWIQPNTIHINDDYADDDRIIPTVAHELIHRKQYKDNRLIYILTSALLRPFYERTAEAWEERFNVEFEIPEQRKL